MFEQELTIYDLLSECPCMKVNKGSMEYLVKEVSKFDFLTLDVTELKDGYYLVELWRVDED